MRLLRLSWRVPGCHHYRLVIGNSGLGSMMEAMILMMRNGNCQITVWKFPQAKRLE